jgi:hypothetical protein
MLNIYTPTTTFCINGIYKISSNDSMLYFVNQTANSYLLKEPSLFDNYFLKQQYDYLNEFVNEI